MNTDLVCEIFGVQRDAVAEFITSQFAQSTTVLYDCVNKYVAERKGVVSYNSYDVQDDTSVTNVRVVPYTLCPDEMATVQKFFPEFKLIVKNQENVADNVYASISVLCKEVIYTKIGEGRYDVIEIDPDFVVNAKRGRVKTHNCILMEYAHDENRFKSNLMNMRTVQDITGIKSNATLKLNLSRFFHERESRVCNDARHCYKGGEVLLVNHLYHSIPILQVMMSMYQHHCTFAYGFFIYVDMMEESDYGYITELGMMYHIDRRNDKVIIRTEKDMWVPYYRWSELQRMVRMNGAVVNENSNYYYELYDRRGCIYFYSIVDLSEKVNKIEYPKHAIWRSGLDDMVMVKSIRLKRGEREEDNIFGASRFVDGDDPWAYEPYQFLVHKRTYEKGVSYACNLPTEVFTFERVFERLVDYNSTRIISGTTVTKVEGENVENLYHLAYVIYVTAYVIRYDENYTMKMMLNSEKLATMVTKSPLYKKLFYVFTSCFSEFKRLLCGEKLHKWILGLSLEKLPVDILIPVVEKPELFIVYDDVLVVNSKTYKGYIKNFNHALCGDEVLKVLYERSGFFSRLAKVVYDSKVGVDNLVQSLKDEVIVKKRCKMNDADERYIQSIVQSPIYDENNTLSVGRVEVRVPRPLLHEEEFKPMDIVGKRLEIKQKVYDTTDVMPTTKEFYETFTSEVTYVEEARKKTTVKISNCCNVLQEQYDSCFPGASTMDRTFDAYNVNDDDLSINMFTPMCKMNVSKIEPLKTRMEFECNFRTAKAPRRPRGFKEKVLTINGRNMGVVKARNTTEFTLSINRILKNFLKMFCKPDSVNLIKQFKANPLYLNAVSLSHWLAEMPDDKVDKYNRVEDHNPDHIDNSYFHLDIKPDVKARGEKDQEFKYAKLQTITYPDNGVNATYSSIGKEMHRRIELLLSDNVLYNTKKDTTKIKEFCNKHIPYGAKTYSIEADVSQYDKSQDDFCKALQQAFYELLGVNVEDLDRMRQADSVSTYVDMVSGLLVKVSEANKSGVPFTLTNNSSLILMALADVLAKFLVPADIACSMLLGDDTTAITYKTIDTHKLSEYFAQTFNLLVKVFVCDVPYFCSSYILETANGVKYVPDPIKMMEKISYVSTAEEEKLHEIFISRQDNLREYSDYVTLKALDLAVQRRMGFKHSIMPALRALYTVSVDWKEFRALYSDKPRRIYG